VAIYPPEIERIASAPRNAGTGKMLGPVGRAVNFDCGSVVSFEVAAVESAVGQVRFSTNGCGYMIAAAELLSRAMSKQDLSGLHGLDPNALALMIESESAAFPVERRECHLAAIEALRQAFADLRRRRVDEFRGEEALICTCFGVTENALERCIDENGLLSVGEVTEKCRAGGGCGACRMVIQEVLDAREAGTDML
jgi:NifU-like protein